MSNTLTYTDFVKGLWGSSSLKNVIYNVNEGYLAISYRTNPEKWYVYNASDAEIATFVAGIEKASSKGRYVNDWTLGRHSDRVVHADPVNVRIVPVIPESERKSGVGKSGVAAGNRWKAVFAIGDAEFTLTETFAENVDAEATLRDRATGLFTKGEPRLKELTRTFE
jgi:hypothetical protein